MRSIAAPLLFALALAAHAQSEKPRVALQGHDPVAYFTQQKPVKGTPRLSHDWDGARYHFANAGHRDLFAADPERYAPRFSGNCTGAVSKGMRYEADPNAWSIIDGKLYVFSSAKTKRELESDPAAIARAESNWKSMR